MCTIINKKKKQNLEVFIDLYNFVVRKIRKLQQMDRLHTGINAQQISSEIYKIIKEILIQLYSWKLQRRSLPKTEKLSQMCKQHAEIGVPQILVKWKNCRKSLTFF